MHRLITAPLCASRLVGVAANAAPGFDRNRWPDLANATWADQVDDCYGSPDEPRCGTQTMLVAGAIAADHRTTRLRDDQGGVTWAKQ